jgi:hypothetical protein
MLYQPELALGGISCIYSILLILVDYILGIKIVREHEMLVHLIVDVHALFTFTMNCIHETNFHKDVNQGCVRTD